MAYSAPPSTYGRLTNAADAARELQGSARGRRYERIVGNNTKLLRIDGERLLALKLHDTIIAWYHEDHVQLQVGQWRSKLSMYRLEEWTPARLWMSDGFWFLCEQGSWDKSVMWRDGIRVRPDGGVYGEPPIMPVIQRNIQRAYSFVQRASMNYAKRCITKWDRMDDEPACEVCPDSDLASTVVEDYPSLQERNRSHVLEHMRANQPILVKTWANTKKNHPDFYHLNGAPLKNKLAHELGVHFRELLTPVALSQAGAEPGDWCPYYKRRRR